MIQLDFSKPFRSQLALLNTNEIWMAFISDFIIEWNNKSDVVNIKTSGTTGAPKVITVKKDWMRFSANNTLKYFNLSKGNTALLALSSEFIGGKMMLVRAMVGQLKLWICPPSDLSILESNISLDFCPLVPIQAQKYNKQLYKIQHVLLGGAPVSLELEHQLQKLKCQVYQSFAMTETLSHIALRNLSKKETNYTVFKSIDIGVNTQGCLWIKAPQLGQDFIQTTDIVNINENTFTWKGRLDFIINSGGIKYNPEALEKSCAFLNNLGYEFIFSSIKDPYLGEKIVLVVEKEIDNNKPNLKLKKSSFKIDKYAIPKLVYFVKKLPRTQHSKKIKRLDKLAMFSSLNIIEIQEIT